jgi:DNA recombination protein RmuC
VNLTDILAIISVFLLGFLIGVLIMFLINRYQQHQVEQFTKHLASRNQSEFAALSMQALEQASTQFLKLANETLSKQTEHNAQELEGKKALIDQTLQVMHSELDGVNKIVIELEKDRVQKFSQLSQQLKIAAEQTGKLQETTNQLHSALASSQTRGQWGERMAEDVLRMAGFIEGINYLKQETSASRSRPDFTFLLPKGLKLNMDVKFPLDNYLKYIETDNPDEQQHYKNRFLKDVKLRINEVTNRAYINRADNTVDYVLVFIPNEQIFAFITENDESLGDQALAQKVVLCSPLTLFAVLAVIRQAVDNFYIEERASQILNLLAEFKKQWGMFIDSFDSLGKKLESAQKEYQYLTSTRQNQLDKSFEKIDDLRQQEKLKSDDPVDDWLLPSDEE